MAITDEQLSGLSQGSGLDAQLQGSVVEVAVQIQAEPEDTPNHANRIKWAAATFRSPTQAAQQMRSVAYGMNRDICEPSGLTISDADLQATVAEAVNTFADGS